MFNTARTSARTLLMAAGTAGFVALGTGIAGADVLGDATGGLALDDLGGQVPAPLTEGLTTPLGELAKIEPGQISARPDVRHQSAPEALGVGLGDLVSTDAPITTGQDNAADIGPLSTVLDSGQDVLPLAQAAPTTDPLSGLLGGNLLGGDLLSGLGVGGGTLPLAQAAPTADSPASGLLTSLFSSNFLGDLYEPSEPQRSAQAAPAADPLSDLLGEGLLSEGTLPLAAAESPVTLVDSQNTDLTGGAAGLVSDLVLSDDVLPMSAGRGDLPQPIGDAPIELLPVPEDALPVAGPEVASATELLVDTVRTTQLSPSGDTFGNDLVGVKGMPDLGLPAVDTGALDDTLSGDLV
ncbi:hypothetical protein [Nocardiopsis sp. ATB16-24]|uniref:hypothetical protein n=1 Tax=Nocardiopsis sp. ATB16-24 TaxID=3019555 RepID=UPI002555E265|nr:hypothetical protein [Nocardiopsis sp. ATB16-24]